MQNEKLHVLGTGNSDVINCYNTCFTIEDDGEHLLVDAGGGNGILRILHDQEIPLQSIHHIIATHEHTDHILGIIWLIRGMALSMNRKEYDGDLHIYGHSELMGKIRTICEMLLYPRALKLFDDRIFFVPVEDGEKKVICGHEVTFFDIHSTKAKQFGFSYILNSGEKLTCLGDEPYCEENRQHAENARWLLSEAFCLYAERDIYDPYTKHHSTAKDAAEKAEELGVENLVIWHTEDSDLPHRKENYGREAKEVFSGNVFVPYDQEIIKLTDTEEE